MKKQQVKFQPRQQTQEEVEESQSLKNGEVAREFSSPEEVLRFDAEQTEVPAAVEERLAESIRKEGDPPEGNSGGWWRNLFL
jgi:hypothetical protein